MIGIDHLNDFFFKGDIERVLYCSNDFFLRRGWPSPQNLNEMVFFLKERLTVSFLIEWNISTSSSITYYYYYFFWKIITFFVNFDFKGDFDRLLYRSNIFFSKEMLTVTFKFEWNRFFLKGEINCLLFVWLCIILVHVPRRDWLSPYCQLCDQLFFNFISFEKILPFLCIFQRRDWPSPMLLKWFFFRGDTDHHLWIWMKLLFWKERLTAPFSLTRMYHFIQCDKER